MKPTVGERWRRKRDGRVARITGVLGPSNATIEYKHTCAPEKSRGYTGMIRTNRTCVSERVFLAQWEKLDI